MHIFEGNSGKPILSLLRPGKRPSGKEIARVLGHVIQRIRRHWPKVRVLIRGDGHYCAWIRVSHPLSGGGEGELAVPAVAPASIGWITPVTHRAMSDAR